MPRAFKPLRIPKELQRALPFKDKPKVPKEIHDEVQRKRIAVVRDPKEKKVCVHYKQLCKTLIVRSLF